MADTLIPPKDERLVDAFGIALEGITALSRAFDRSLREEAGIPSSWFEALLRLHRHGDTMAVGQLGDQLALTSGGATRLVDRLEAEGLVERRPCPTDRRVQFVALTDDGDTALATALDVHLADLKRLFGDRTTARDRAELVRIFDALRETGADTDG